MSEVHITASGPIGSGKSALLGEVEIMCHALGIPVRYADEAAAQDEKNMTHADWVRELENIKPTVVLIEGASHSPPVERDAVYDALASELSHGAYDCGRVWSAWSVGTMSEDDFTPVSCRLDDITDTVMAALKSQPVAAPTAQPEAKQWQPIETAPKDGAEVLLYLGKPWDRIAKARWFAQWANWQEGEEYPGADDEYCGIGSGVPTHWMPLPSAPTAQQEGDGNA